MSTPVDLTLVQGVPLRVTITIPDGATLWPGGHQVWGLMRRTAHKDQTFDLTPHLTATLIAGGAMEVVLSMSGALTRTIPSECVYDIFVAEPGTAQEQAVRVHGTVTVEPAIAGAPPTTP